MIMWKWCDKSIKHKLWLTLIFVSERKSGCGDFEPEGRRRGRRGRKVNEMKHQTRKRTRSGAEDEMAILLWILFRARQLHRP